MITSNNNDREVQEAFHKREMQIEHRINIARAVGSLCFAGMDTISAIWMGGIVPELIVFIAISIVLFGTYLTWIHRITRSGQSYHPWVKYITITIDSLLMAMIYMEYKKSGQWNLLFSPEVLVLYFTLCFVLLTVMSALRHSQLAIIYATILNSVLVVLLTQIAFGNGLITAYGFSFIIITGGLTLWISRSHTRLFLRLRQREGLMRFLSKEIVEKIDAGILKLDLGGEKRTVTILMSDIRGFTSFSEKRDPEEVIGILNEYLTEMTRIIFTNGGMIDKFIGDAILAVFGAPESKTDDALRAVKTAQEMISALENLNQRWKQQGISQLDIGISLHTGTVVAGNIGSPERMEYTVIGDTVNLTSRIEGLNKTYQTQILFSQETRDRVQEQVKTQRVGESPIRGRSDSVQLYTVLKENPESLS